MCIRCHIISYKLQLNHASPFYDVHLTTCQGAGRIAKFPECHAQDIEAERKGRNGIRVLEGPFYLTSLREQDGTRFTAIPTR